MKKDLYYVSRKETIEEIAIRNVLPVSKVREIYNNFVRHYSKSLMERIKLSPELYDKVFYSTEKYIDTQRYKELKKLKSERGNNHELELIDTDAELLMSRLFR